MFNYINEENIERFIKEDVPYFDLTSQVLDIGKQSGRIQFYCREDAVICGTEEVLRMFHRFDIQPLQSVPSGSKIGKEEIFLSAQGKADNLHHIWKPAQNMLEYCSGMATRTSRMVQKARKIKPSISILTTRKIFPGTKDLSIKSILAGGAYPHRLGLSESILIFKQHINFLGGFEELRKIIPVVKQKACEKKVTVEVDSIEEALMLAEWGVDSIQFDKLDCESLKKAVNSIKPAYPHILLIAAGGINEKNVEEYAATGVDALVTTSVYFGKPVDIGVLIEPIG